MGTSLSFSGRFDLCQVRAEFHLKPSLNSSTLPRVTIGITGCPNASGCGQSRLCPLSRVVAGTAVRIKQLDAPPEVSSRLREMGLGEDQRVKLLSCQPNFICLVCNARLALNARLAESILVEPLAALS